MGRRRHIREVLEALEWARIERMRTGSPDFVRARVLEESVQRLADRLTKGKIHHRDTEATEKD